MGSQHVYDLSAAGAATTTAGDSAAGAPKGTKRKAAGATGSGIDVALNPEDLTEGLDDETIRKKYEQQLDVSKNGAAEDFSDMVAEHASRQAKKRVKKDDKSKDKDKSKNFKF